MTQATTLSLQISNNVVSDEQLLQEMDCALLPGGVKNLVLAYSRFFL